MTLKIGFLCLLALPLYGAHAIEAKVDLSKGDLIDGEVRQVKITWPDSSKIPNFSLGAKVFNLYFPFFKSETNPDEYYGLIAAPLGVENGEYSMRVETSHDKKVDVYVPVKIRKEVRTEEMIEAPEDNILPKNAAVVSRVASEDLELKSIFKKTSPKKIWKENFILPLEGKISSTFGIYRVYSKHLRRRTHWGIDIKTPIGTKVHASAKGNVVLAKDLYFPGQTIIIDHGLGLYTGYSHLSKMKVKVGDPIKRGQIIGISGISGKTSGPHLHWMAVNSKVKVDPLSLLKINLK